MVLRYRDGGTVHCTLASGFAPGADAVEVILEDGSRLTVPLEDLKAVFFLKNPKQRALEMELGLPAGDAPAGTEARVEFFDGEIIHGRIDHYAVADRGFFLYPSSLDTNNERIFVVASALRTLAIGG